MRLASRIHDCLCLNWAVPASILPPPPPSLSYELHPWEGADHVFVSALLFHHREVHIPSLPLVKLSFPQLNLRTYVVDAEGMPAVLFAAVLVPPWVVPTALLAGGRPARPGRFERIGEPGGASGTWEWQVRTGEGGLHCIARLGSPAAGEGPRIGSWRETVDYVRLRNRGYVHTRGALRSIETEQPTVAVSPVEVELTEIGLLPALLGARSWPRLHSAWVCPEMRMRFDLVRDRSLALPQQAPVPG